MKRKSASKKNYEDASEEEETQHNGDSEQPKSKRGRKSKNAKNDDSSEADENSVSEDAEEDPLAASEEDAQYEVEKVLDEKTVRGKKHYLIRWKGYTEEEDTWEPESTLDCSDLIQQFKNNKKEEKASSSNKTDKKSSSSKTKTEKKKSGKNKSDDQEENWDEDHDFEVGRILDVHFCRDGKKEFLISWKGYSQEDNSWEPEDNLDCKDMIEKFMKKVEKARSVDNRELRVNRKPVERLNFAMYENARKLSKRRKGKERVTYFDTE